MLQDDDRRLVAPDGLAIRRRRHDKRWSARELVGAIAEASWLASGRRDTITPDELRGIEERGERVSLATLRLVAQGLDCDPADILRE